jgi:anti-anti-sigma factor
MDEKPHGAALEPTVFGIESETTQGVHVISLRGELDLATAPELRRILEDELGGLEPVLLNLSDCEFIDSTGIAVIVRAWQHRLGSDGASEMGGLLGLCAPAKQVSRLLEVTGVDTSITVFETCDEGVAALAKRCEQDS